MFVETNSERKNEDLGSTMFIGCVETGEGVQVCVNCVGKNKLTNSDRKNEDLGSTMFIGCVETGEGVQV